MEQNNKKQLLDFYLDVARYSFNYLFDHNFNRLVIELEDYSESDFVSILCNHSFRLIPSKKTNFISLSYVDIGITVEYVEKEPSITFKEFIAHLFEYADLDDMKIKNVTKKHLFRDALSDGLRILEIRKYNYSYSS